MKRFLHAFAMFACLVLPLQMWGQVTLQYLGTETTNMTENNNAATVGLSEADWSVVGDKGGHNNFPGLNKDGTIRLYYKAEGSNTITVTNLNGGTITSIVVTYKSNYNNGTISVGGTQVTGIGNDTEKSYDINATSFVIGNGNTSNVQVHIVKIVINNTPPSTPPTITTYPLNNGVQDFIESEQPTFTFSKAVRMVGGEPITKANAESLITFKNAANEDVNLDSVTINADNTVITVWPTPVLAGSTTYTLTCAPVEDAYGNATKDTTITFTTRDANAKSIDNIAADKPRYFWGETAVLTWDAKNLGDDVGAGIRVYKGTTLLTDDSKETIYLPVITAMGIPTNLNSNEAYIPLTDEAFAVLKTTLVQRVKFSNEYKLQVVAGTWSSEGFTPLNPECVSAQTTDITIIPNTTLNVIREYLPKFNGDSLRTTGVVTAVNGTSFAIQGVGNQNSGLQVSKAKAQPTGVEPIAVGDSVAVLGVLAKDTYKLWKITDGSVVTRLASGKTLPAPIERSMAESLDPQDSVYFGMLVELSDVVTSLKGANDKPDTLVSGINKMVAFNTFMTRNALKGHFVEGNTYRVRGVLSAYNEIAQICPRNSFDIAPAVAPVPEFAPANDADKVLLNTPITITFDRPMRKVGGAELTNADLASLIAFKDAAQDTAVLFAATICPSKDTIYIKPSVSLNGPIEYAVTLQPLEDYFGQAMATTTSSFTTLNPDSPHVETATIAAATRYLWGEDIVVNFDAKHYTSPTEGYAVLLRDGVSVDSVVIADIAANTATFALGSGSGKLADGDTYSTNYTIRVGSGADASATTTPFCVIATPTIQHLRQNFATYTDGDTVAVVGVVTGATWNTQYKNGNIMFQNGTEPFSGFYLFRATDSLAIGDSIRAICRVKEAKDDYVGVYEQDGTVIIEKLGTANVPAPIEMTISEAAKNDYQSMLVKIKNVKASVGTNVSIEDNTASMSVYSTFYQGDFASCLTDGKTYDVTGLMTLFKGGAQIFPRMASDIVEVTSTPSTPATPSAVAANTLSVKAYPNPFGNEIRVEGVDVRRVEIYNVVGQLVMQTNAVHGGVVSTANLPTGIYLVRFVDANGRAAVLKMSKR